MQNNCSLVAVPHDYTDEKTKEVRHGVNYYLRGEVKANDGTPLLVSVLVRNIFKGGQSSLDMLALHDSDLKKVTLNVSLLAVPHDYKDSKTNEVKHGFNYEVSGDLKTSDGKPVKVRAFVRNLFDGGQTILNLLAFHSASSK